MDLTFQVPMKYCSLQHLILLPLPVTSTTGCCFCFGSVPSFFLHLFLHWSSSILGTSRPAEFIFQCPIFFPFHTVHGVLKPRILKWFAIPFSSGPQGDHTKLWKTLKEMRIPDHLTCLLRNLYAGEEPTVRTWYGTMNWFKIEKGVCQGCILSPCRGPAPADPGYSKQGRCRRGSGYNSFN